MTTNFDATISKAKDRKRLEQKLLKESFFELVPETRIFRAIHLECNTLTIPYNGQPGALIGHDFGDLLRQMERAMRAMAKSRKPLVTPQGGISRKLQAEGFGAPRLIDVYLSLSRYRTKFRLGEFSELLFQAASELGLLVTPRPEAQGRRWELHANPDKDFSNPAVVSSTTPPHELNTYEDIVLAICAQMRQYSQLPQFHNRVHKRRESALSNLESARQLIKGAFEQAQCVQVIGLRLSYKPEFPVSIEGFKRDLQRLRRNQRSNPGLFRGLLGIVWRFEYGLLGTGTHVQYWLVYNAAISSKQWDLAERLQSYWSWGITKGWGITTNCRDDFLSQNQSGLGYIRQDDLAKRKELDIALQMLTLKDQWLRPLIQGDVFGIQGREKKKQKIGTAASVKPRNNTRGLTAARTDFSW